LWHQTSNNIQQKEGIMKLESTIPGAPNMKESKNDESGEVCIANINAEGRRRRLRFGIVQFVLAIVVLAVLMATGVDRLWRLPLFFIFVAAATGYFQWHDKTCVAFARQGVFELNGGVEKMDNADQLAQVRRQARRLMVKAFLVAIPLTLLVFILG
jgi:hypothetical protein